MKLSQVPATKLDVVFILCLLIVLGLNSAVNAWGDWRANKKIDQVIERLERLESLP